MCTPFLLGRLASREKTVALCGLPRVPLKRSIAITPEGIGFTSGVPSLLLGEMKRTAELD